VSNGRIRTRGISIAVGGLLGGELVVKLVQVVVIKAAANCLFLEEGNETLSEFCCICDGFEISNVLFRQQRVIQLSLVTRQALG
jgi:hypothetical protein